MYTFVLPEVQQRGTSVQRCTSVLPKYFRTCTLHSVDLIIRYKKTWALYPSGLNMWPIASRLQYVYTYFRTKVLPEVLSYDTKILSYESTKTRTNMRTINWSAWDEFGSFSGETDRLSLEWAPFTVQRSAPRPPCLIKNYSTVSIFVRKRCPYLARAYSIDNVCSCVRVDL